MDSVTDPDPGSGAFLTSGSGMGKNQDPDPGSRSGMNNPDHISERKGNHGEITGELTTCSGPAVDLVVFQTTLY
jgi:hypothetical protein